MKGLQSCLVISLLFFISISGMAQLPFGAQAPNFSVTDINGNNFTLSDYTASKRGAVLDFFGTWCAPCWGYHQSGILEDIHNTVGTGGSNLCGVIELESDSRTNVDCLYDLPTCSYTTQGNYTLVGNQIADLNPTNGAGVATAYSITRIPTLYVISHDNRAFHLKSKGFATIKSWIEESFFLDANPVVYDSPCGDDGSVILNRVKGYGGINYYWSNGDDTENLENVGGGVYSVTIEDQNGYDKAFGPFTIIGPPGPIEIELNTYEDVACQGDASGSIQVSSSGGNTGHTYLWSDGQTTPRAIALRAGVHRVTVTDSKGCFKTEEYHIVEPTKLRSTGLVTNEECGKANGAIYINPGGGIPPYKFDIGEGLVQEGSFEGLAAGDYAVTIYDDHDCENVFSTKILSINGPTVDAGFDRGMTCKDSVLRIEATGSRGAQYSYLWETTDGLILDGDTTSIVYIGTPGTYTFTVIDDALECSVSDEILIEDLRVFPAVEMVEKDSLDCFNPFKWVGVELDSLYDYSWTELSGKLDSEFDSSMVKVVEKGEFVITVIDSANGCLITDTITINEDKEDPVIVLDDAFLQTCPDLIMEVKLSLGVNKKYTIDWTTQDGRIVEQDSHIIKIDLPGTYYVNVVDQDNGCAGMDSFELLEDWNIPVSNFIWNSSALEALFDNRSVGEDLDFIWSFGDGEMSMDSDPTHLYTTPGKYEVCLEVTNPCSTSIKCDSIEVDSIRSPFQVVQYEVKHIDCFGDSTGEIRLEVIGGYPPYDFIWSNGKLSSVINNLKADRYSVEVRDQKDELLKQEIDVKENLPLIESSANLVHPTSSSGGSLNLDLNGGVSPYQYEWSNGQRTKSILDLDEGEYWCTVTDALGCIKTFGPYRLVLSTGVRDHKEDLFYLFPNPTRGLVNMISLNEGIQSWVIRGADGILISTDEKAVGLNVKLDLSGLNPGLYFVDILLVNGQRGVQRIVLLSY